MYLNHTHVCYTYMYVENITSKMFPKILNDLNDNFEFPVL